MGDKLITEDIITALSLLPRKSLCQRRPSRRWLSPSPWEGRLLLGTAIVVGWLVETPLGGGGYSLYLFLQI